MRNAPYSNEREREGEKGRTARTFGLIGADEGRVLEAGMVADSLDTAAPRAAKPRP